MEKSDDLFRRVRNIPLYLKEDEVFRLLFTKTVKAFLWMRAQKDL